MSVSSFRGGLVARTQKLSNKVEAFVVGQRFAIDLCVRDIRHQIVLRAGLAGRDPCGEELSELELGPQVPLHLRPAGVLVSDRHDQVVGPSLELLEVVFAHAQRVCNDRHGKGYSELAHELHIARASDCLEELL